MDILAIKAGLQDFFAALANEFPNYEHRPVQNEIISLILNANYKNKHVLVEAGTGTGKSLAYLLAVLALLAGGEEKRIVISTHTINLQEQLLYKDIPLLQRLLAPYISFTAALAKGRSNYLCLRRWLELEKDPEGHTAEIAALKELIYEEGKIVVGDRSLLPINISQGLWSNICASHLTCLERRCPMQKQCFFRAARDSLKEADIVISNHALFFTDLAIKGGAENEEGILPPYNLVIFDEAHHMEDVACQALSLRIDEYYLKTVGGTFRSLLTKGSFKAFLVNEPVESMEIEKIMRDYFIHIDEFLQDLQNKSRGQTTRLKKEEAEIKNPFVDDLRFILQICQRLESLELSDEETLLLEKSSGQWKKIREELDFILNVADDKYVYWIESNRQNYLNSTIQAAPIEIADSLRETIFRQDVVCVLTSATLASPSLDFTAGRLGVADYFGAVLASPFDHETNAAVFLPPQAIEPSYQNNQAYEHYLAQLILETATLVDGGSFILFTSYLTLNNVYLLTADSLNRRGLTVLKQGDAPRHELLGRHKAAGKGILFATSSFWEGVDVSGSALSCVIITKLPFAVPDHPLTAARIETLRAKGYNPFMSYQLPQAIIRFKQGYGRLIRSRDDRGVVVVADPRVRSKRYGKLFLDALPCKNRLQNRQDLQQFLLTQGLNL